MFSRSLLRRFLLRSITGRVFHLSLIAMMALGYLVPQVYAAAFDTSSLGRDNSFKQTGLVGLNNAVYSTVLQSDGKVLVG